MTKKLWLATVEHVEVPGTLPTLFFQENEPTDDEIKSRFSSSASSEELEIAGLFNLSHVCAQDEASRKAIQCFVDAGGTK